jgi:hypothetical protein
MHYSWVFPKPGANPEILFSFPPMAKKWDDKWPLQFCDSVVGACTCLQAWGIIEAGQQRSLASYVCNRAVRTKFARSSPQVLDVSDSSFTTFANNFNIDFLST